jgi:hypothetical protein
MATERMLAGKKLPLTLAFTVLLVFAFGVSCKGFFQAPTLTSITINPASPSVQLDSTATLQAFGVNSDGTGSYLTSGVSWSTSDDAIATVTGNGSATLSGVGLGTATITASAESVTNTASAIVFITVSKLTIAPLSQTITPNGTTPDPFIVTATTSQGPIDVSSGATLNVYQNGTLVSTIGCDYDDSGVFGPPGQYCTGTAAVDGAYQIVATYTGTTQTATATLNVSGT